MCTGIPSHDTIGLLTMSHYVYYQNGEQHILNAPWLRTIWNDPGYYNYN